MKAKIFIGSSSEGRNVARALAAELDDIAACRIWHQGVFGLGQDRLQALWDALPDYEFAILVLTADDAAVVRGQQIRLPRDNVLFELGLFMGAYGRQRVFVVQHDQADLLSDFEGIETAKFSLEGRPLAEHSIEDLRPLLNRAYVKLQEAIREAQESQTIDKVVHYIPPSATPNPYYEHLQLRLEAEFAKLGNISWHLYPPPGSSAEDQRLAFQQVVKRVGRDARRSDFVVLAGLELDEEDGSGSYYEQIREVVEERRSLVVFFEQAPPERFLELQGVSFVGVNNRQVGLLAAFALYKELSGAENATYVALRGPGGQLRVEGFERGMGHFGRTDVQVVDVSDGDRFQSMQDIRDIVQGTSAEVSIGVFAGNDETAAAVLRARESQNRDNVYVVGCDATREMRFDVSHKRPGAVATIDTGVREQAAKILRVRARKLRWLETPRLFTPFLQGKFNAYLNESAEWKALWQR